MRSDESEVRLLQTVVASMGVALENARLFDETQRLLKETEQRNAELAVINSIQRAVSAEFSFQGIVDLVGDNLREVFATGNIGIRWWDEAADTLHYLYVYEHGRRLRPVPLTPTLGIPWGPFMRQREISVMNTLAEQAALGVSAMPGTDRALSILAVPIVASERVLGTVSLENHEREHAFGPAEIRLLQTVAASMSVALENARLFAETQRRAREARALADVGRDLSSSLDLAVVMDRIAGHAKELLRASDSAIFLPEAGTTGTTRSSPSARAPRPSRRRRSRRASASSAACCRAASQSSSTTPPPIPAACRSPARRGARTSA